MDFDLRTLVDTITYEGDGTRSIAYDSSYDAFWVNNWASSMKLINRSGEVIRTLPDDISAIYGSAYDPYSDGGPFLWIHSGVSTGSIAKIEQIALTDTTSSLTAVNHTSYSTAKAGGMFLTRDIVPGTVTLGALTREDALYGLEVSGIEWISIENPVGIIEPESTDSITVNIDFNGFKNSLKDSTVTEFDLNAIVRLKDENNIYSANEVSIHVDFTSVNDIEENNIIQSFKLEQNYPNPFNPVTRINYELAITNYEFAEIIVHNMIGQKVWSSPVTSRGSHEMGSITFDGSSFNSGVYYYSLIVDGISVDTKKMIMIK